MEMRDWRPAEVAKQMLYSFLQACYGRTAKVCWRCRPRRLRCTTAAAHAHASDVAYSFYHQQQQTTRVDVIKARRRAQRSLPEQRFRASCCTELASAQSRETLVQRVLVPWSRVWSSSAWWEERCRRAILAFEIER